MVASAPKSGTNSFICSSAAISPLENTSASPILAPIRRSLRNQTQRRAGAVHQGAAGLTAQLPEELRENIQAVLDRYGNLGHNELLSRVCEEFSAYAKKSRHRKTATSKTGGTKL